MSEEELAKWQCEMYNNSEGSLNAEDGYNCEKCKNKGFIAFPSLQGRYWNEVHRECECQKIRRTLIRLSKSGLKGIIKKYTFEKYVPKEQWQEVMKKKAEDFVANGSDAWFFVGGQSGCGKTHLCTAIAGKFLLAGKGVRYMLWRDEITKLKACINDSEKYEQLVTGYKTTPVLYIDDLFKNGKDQFGHVQPPTASDVQIAFEILNYRYNNRGLITIISSERTIHEIVELDEAVGGRISERSTLKGFAINIAKDTKKNFRLKQVTEL